MKRRTVMIGALSLLGGCVARGQVDEAGDTIDARPPEDHIVDDGVRAFVDVIREHDEVQYRDGDGLATTDLDGDRLLLPWIYLKNVSDEERPAPTVDDFHLLADGDRVDPVDELPNGVDPDRLDIPEGPIGTPVPDVSFAPGVEVMLWAPFLAPPVDELALAWERPDEPTYWRL